MPNSITALFLKAMPGKYHAKLQRKATRKEERCDYVPLHEN